MQNNIYIEKAKEYLTPALRKYQHNDCSDNFVTAFDYNETIELMANMIEIANLGMSKGEKE